MNPMVQFTLRAARSAAEQFLRVRERIENAHEESNLERLLEDAGRKAEATIVHQLERGYPHHGVSGRYTAHKAGEGEGAEIVWKIEPFHGYSNLTVAGRGFAISVVCLIKGRPEHAVIVAPFGDDEYIASRGSGAQHNGKRMRVSKATALAGTRLAMSMPAAWLRSDHLPTYLSVTQHIAAQSDTQVATGSGLMDICEFATGRVDSVFVLGLDEQDLQVGTLLLKEAGALMGTPSGQPVVKPEGQLMAAGPRLYKALLKQLAPL
ncbi:inositol monophosphatase family protein [Vreelandella malpeensis]|uniref:Inositol monophosphatase n=1 Tax=Vreelandella malpeensis TaxID=1172368 RepID=A0ABS8DRX2_9GAMM|nr:inositol monophosphatase family protein [Halomonas malpeensis]MCB8888998.1 inositol monophosphatase [Halomonas malpeensis]